MSTKSINQKSKLILFFAIIFTILGSAFLPVEAAYLKNVPQTITQPDGSKIDCFASGDEYYHWVHDKDGYTIVRDTETSEFRYARLVGGKLVASEYQVGKVNPMTTNLEKNANISGEEMMRLRNTFYDEMNKAKSRVEKKTGNKLQAGTKGTINDIVIFIRFASESEFGDAISLYNTLFNSSSSASLYSYFEEVTYDQLSITSTFYPTPGSNVVSYQDSHARGYFEPYDANDNPDGYQTGTESREREHKLLKDATDAVSSQIPGSLNIDTDSDGYVDNVVYIVSGSPGGWSDLLWPHRWSLSSETVMINGKRVWDYNLQLQNYLKAYGSGVICHEMFHTLGAPDLYHYNGDNLGPVEQWDLMAATSNPAQHMGAYMKHKYGDWITTIPEITTGGTYSLNPLTSSTNNCYQIASPNSSTEYFIVEYRYSTGGYDSALPSFGLVVYRIKESISPNGNRNGPPDEVYVYRPGGTLSAKGTPANATFSASHGRTSINKNTNPTPFLGDGSAGGLDISNVSLNGSTISFDVNFGPDAPTLTTPTDNSGPHDTEIDFEWNTSAGALEYDFQVDDAFDFASPEVSEVDLASTDITVSTGLSDGTQYYWRVRARNALGNSAWSNIFSFTTFMEEPALTSPDDEEINLSTEGTVSWESVFGATTYELQIASDIGFNNMEFTSHDSYITEDDYTGLPYYTELFWRVRGVNSLGNGLWSEIYTFQTILAAPTLMSPAIDSIGSDSAGTFTWSSVASVETYNLRYADNPSFTSPTEIELIDTELLDYSDLEFNTTYYWQVKSINTDSESEWSETANFTTNLSYPTLVEFPDAEIGVPINGTLEWEAVDGAEVYTLQISDTVDFAELLIQELGIVETEIDYEDMEYKTVYYWRLSASNSDTESDWSEVRSFRTNLKYPNRLTPQDSAGGMPLNGTLTWEAIDDAQHYELFVSEFENFTQLIIQEENLTETEYNYENLEYNKLYYWRMIGVDSEDRSDVSPTYTFTTILDRPVLLLPEDESADIPVSGRLTWETTSGAEFYKVQISDIDDFSSLVVDDDEVDIEYYDYSGLDGEKTYYWRVFAINDGGVSSASDERSFETSILLGTTTLVSPEDNSFGSPLSGTLVWDETNYATSYNVKLSYEPDMSSGMLIDESGVTTTEYAFSGLDRNTAYYWTVQAVNDDGSGPTSGIFKFTTIGDSPTPVSPADLAIGLPLSGPLTWNEIEDAVRYGLQLSESEDFGTTLINLSEIYGISHDYSALKCHTQYWWRVNATVNSVTTEWSPAISFTTILAAPKATAPTNNATEIAVDGSLYWEISDGAETYNLVLAEDENFGVKVIDKTGIEATEYAYEQLTPRKKYFWKVYAVNGGGTSEPCATTAFTTGDGVSVNSYNSKITSYELYPNPVGSSAVLKFTLETAEYLNISIVNTQGQNIISVSDRIQRKGMNEVNISVENMVSGVYYIKIVGEAGTDLLKFAVVK